MIVLKPNGGLCNRLRAIDSAIVLSQKINSHLKVLWPLLPELNCSYHALFKLPDNMTVVDIKAGYRPSSQWTKKIYSMYSYGMVRTKYHHVIFQSKMNRLCNQNYDFTQLGEYDSVYITCCNRFYRTERKYQPLRPVESIEKIVDSITKDYSVHTVGVHVRRTDHHTVSAYSSTQSFINAMNMEIDRNSETRFYLATDSLDVMSQLTGLFRDRIIWRDKDYSRNSPTGIQDALIDLLCLSKTDNIIGNYLSSFSETAAQLNDIQIVYIKGKTA